MKRIQAERLQDRAIKDGFTHAQLRQWGTGWALLLLPVGGSLVGGVTIHTAEEYEEALALSIEQPAEDL